MATKSAATKTIVKTAKARAARRMPETPEKDGAETPDAPCRCSISPTPPSRR